VGERTEPWLFSDDGNIAGWCDYMDFWDEAIATAPRGAILVEVGVFCGRSLIELAKRAKAANKSLRVVGVDTFRGSAEHAEGLKKLPNGALAREAWNNLDNAGVLDDVTLMVCESVTAANLLADAEIHAVFLDASHDQASVREDIRAWWFDTNTMAIGGHDYHTFPGVKAAVEEFFECEVPADRSWWKVGAA